MSSQQGILAQVDIPTNNTNQFIYVVPTNTKATVNVNVCNRTSQEIRISLMVTKQGTSPDLTSYLDFERPIAPNDSYQFRGIALNDGNSVFVNSSNTGVSVTVYGVFQEQG